MQRHGVPFLRLPACLSRRCSPASSARSSAFPALRLSRHLSGHRHDRVRLHRRGDLARWESVTNGNEGMRDQARSSCSVSTVSRDATASTTCASVSSSCVHRAGAQPHAFADRPRLHRHPRQRDRGAKHGHRHSGLQGEVVRHQRRHHRARGLRSMRTKCPSSARKCSPCCSRIEFVMVIIIGGAVGLHGAVLGAIFMVMVDPLLTCLKDDVPSVIAGIGHVARRRPSRAQLQDRPSTASPRRRRSQGRHLRPHHHALHRLRAHRGSMAAG